VSRLDLLGWSEALAGALRELAPAELVPARVVREHRGLYRLWGEAGEWAAQIAGRLRHQDPAGRQRPAVGDWVAARPAGVRAVIQAVLPRHSAFIRKVAGDTTEEQVVAANVDIVFLLCGLDGDFNLRRLERYLVMGRPHNRRCMTSTSVRPKRRWRKACGTRPTISKPCLCQRRTAPSLVATTKLNCMAWNPARRATANECSQSLPAMPLPRASGDTMYPAFATWSPRPTWLGFRQ